MTTHAPRRTGVRRTAALLVALTTLILGLVAVTPAHAAPPTSGSLTATVTDAVSGTVADVDITGFRTVDGTTTAIGTVTNPATEVSSPVALPVLDAAAAGPGGSCQILDLVLGPLDLDLLGLVIHLDTVHLNITAQQGPGNLIGNLLCAVVGLFDGPGAGVAAGITALLNRILGALG